MTEVLMTLPFKRRFKDLSKRYRKIQSDIQPIVEALESGEIIGDRIVGFRIAQPNLQVDPRLLILFQPLFRFKLLPEFRGFIKRTFSQLLQRTLASGK